MPTAQMDTVIRHLRRAVLRQDGAGRTDGQLLGSFIDQKDEAAFEALVRRHGPMVFGVCRRVVGNYHDAEDAFQATFLVLARKASSVRPRERVANWLHGVALRTAMKAKTMTAKRRRREKQVTEMPEPEAAQQGQWRDLQPLLDQELNGLPENYRLPILLCDLEGKTIKAAAQQLGWPQGSLAGRLARGRKLLAKRLASRGVVLSAGSLAAVVSQNVASAGVPTSLMSSTVKAAAMIAAGQATVTGLVPAEVAALTEGVLKSMMLTKLSKATVAGLAALCTCGLGIGGFQALSAQETKTTITTTTTTTTITKQSKTDPRLEGTWKLIEHENSGVKTGDWNFVMTFANGWVVMAGDEACGPGEGSFTTVIHPKGNRNDLDVTWTKGSNKGKTTYYSYQIEGDKLHVVGGPQHDQVRWMSISSPPGSGVSHHVLRRVTPPSTAKRVKAEAVEEQEQVEESPFFNGKNLFGWQGLPGYWKVRDGAIIGAPANGIKAHTFLCSEKTYRDFELKFKVKRKGGIGNSGVQIRSKIENREHFTVTGPQIEIDSANFHYPPGSIVTEPVDPPLIKANAAAVADVWEDDGFNDMTIRCEGKWVTVTINGVEVLDTHFPSMPEEGIIAWQLHGGFGTVEAPKEVIFKDIDFKELNVPNRGPTTTTRTKRTKVVAGRSHKTAISGTWTGLGVNSLGWQCRGEMVITEAPDGTLRGTWGAPMRLPIENGKRVTENTFRWDGWEDNFHYDARCTVTGNCLVIDWTHDESTDGKIPRDSGKIVLTRQTTPAETALPEKKRRRKGDAALLDKLCA